MGYREWRFLSRARGDSAKIFTTDGVTSENHRRIPSWGTKIVIHITPYIVLFLKYYLCPEHTPSKDSHRMLDFALVAKGSLFWFSIATSPLLTSDVTRTQSTGNVTSYSSSDLSRVNGRKVDLHQWIKENVKLNTAYCRYLAVVFINKRDQSLSNYSNNLYFD